MNKGAALAALVLAVAAGAAGYFAGGRQAAPDVKPAAPVEVRVPNEIRFPDGAPQLTALRTEAAVEAPLPLAEPLNGKIAYDEDVTARISSPIAGRITSLKAAAGDTVKAGQVLASLDAPDLAAALADTSKAQADEARKRLALERTQKLLEAEVIPRKDYESAAADYAQAQAETRRAGARLKNLSPMPGDGPGLALRSPMGGMVADRKANPATEVQPGGEPLFVVSDLSRLWVLIDLPEHHLAKVKPGLPVSLTVEAYPGETFRAVVARVGQVVISAGAIFSIGQCRHPAHPGALRHAQPGRQAAPGNVRPRLPAYRRRQAGGAPAQRRAGHRGPVQFHIRRDRPARVRQAQGAAFGAGPRVFLRHLRRQQGRAGGDRRRAAAAVRDGVGHLAPAPPYRPRARHA